MKFRSALLASAMMALPLAAANAQPIEGLYIGGGAGVNFLQRETFDLSGRFAGSANSLARSADVRVNPGFGLVVSLGWGFGNGLRAELEGNYRVNNGYNNPQGLGFPASASGDEQKMGGMVNVLYDFVGLTPYFQPYIGAGVGYEAEKVSNFAITPLNSTRFASAQEATKGSFAYQAILGGAFPILSAPGLAITAEYRFMGLTGTRSYAATNATFSNAISQNNYNHAFLVGVRYAFGVAPPPPPPTPVADVGAKTFLVFFDWDKANLTSRSEAIVRDAAAYSTHTQYTRIDVDGNTDTSGTPNYNMGLSERRARVVAGELVRDGVPQAAISMHAYGETKLLVPTGPNVREPQNRRVEIVYH